MQNGTQTRVGAMPPVTPRRSTRPVPGVVGRAAILVWLAACGAVGGGDVNGRVEVRDSAGVRIVTSAGPDTPAPVVLEREWEVGFEGGAGGAGGAGDELLLAELRPWHVSADEAGRVYVLDGVARRVVVLGPGGEMVGTLGRRGQGPGELAAPVSIHVVGGVVGVWDQGQGGLVRWRDGEPLPLARPAASFWGPDVRLVGERTAFVTLTREGVSRQRLLVGGAAGARPLAELEGVPERVAEFPTCGIRGIPVPPLFAPELNWDLGGDRAYASVSAAYEIRVVRLGSAAAGVDGANGDGESAGSGDAAAEGQVVEIWRRGSPARRVTEALALREVGDGLPIPVADCVVPAAEVVRGRGYGDVVPSIRRLALDPTGRVWVLRGGVVDEPNVVDLFDASGAYLGTLPDGAPVPVAFPAPDRLVGLTTDASGLRVLASWRVRLSG